MTPPDLTPEQVIGAPMDCGHPAGCKCVRQVSGQVPCGKDTAALCAAHIALSCAPKRPRRVFSGAPSHSAAELLSELKRNGYVLARVPEEAR